MAFLLLPPVYETVVTDLMDLPEELHHLTYIATMLLLAWPAAIGFRRFYQGILIKGRAYRPGGGRYRCSTCGHGRNRVASDFLHRSSRRVGWVRCAQHRRVSGSIRHMADGEIVHPGRLHECVVQRKTVDL